MGDQATTPPIKLIPAGLAIVAATYGLARYTYGLFVPEIRNELGLTIEVMGLIGSLSYGGYLIATLFGSTVSGVVGPRLPIILGGLGAATGMALIAASQGPWLLGIGVMLAGTSPGLAYPPLSDAVMRLIREPQQNRTYAIINAGTSVGVIISGPAALLAGEEWRLAWAGFAMFAVVATVWNATLMPSGPYLNTHGQQAPQPLHIAWLVTPATSRLFVAATLFGIATAVYWTFAVDLLVQHGAMPGAWTRAFWILIGLFGLIGGAAGDSVRRFGLRRSFTSALIGCSLSILSIAIWSTHIPVALVSAMVFGATFIMITGLFGIWSVNLFQQRPSAGFGVTFFLISAGQLVSPTIAGLLAGEWHMGIPFLLAGGLCAGTALLGPQEEIYAMSEKQASALDKG
ncbi:MAG: MFS transporter [Pseudomonadota bacterium]